MTPTFQRWARAVQPFFEALARAFVVIYFLASAIAGAYWADADLAKAAFPDRLLVCSFVVFSVGLLNLYALFVVLAILGKIDIAQSLYDGVADPDNKTAKSAPKVSFTRLQGFMWSWVILSVYFHDVVMRQANDGLPKIPLELLAAMGISGATSYLVEKRKADGAREKRSDSPDAEP